MADDAGSTSVGFPDKGLDIGALSEIATNGSLFIQNMSQLIQALDGFQNIVLPVPNGGTGRSSFTLNGVLYGNGTSGLLVTAQGGADSVLTANAGAPVFSSTPTLGALTLNVGPLDFDLADGEPAIEWPTQGVGIRSDGTADMTFHGATYFFDDGPIIPEGVLSESPTVGVGYGTGAGTAVTQLTNKSTAVTGTMCGQITTSNATLNANTVVSFTVNVTGVASTDTVVLNHQSGGTFGAYIFAARNMQTNAFDIAIWNVTAGNLSEALVLNYAVTKAVNA